MKFEDSSYLPDVKGHARGIHQRLEKVLHKLCKTNPINVSTNLLKRYSKVNQRKAIKKAKIKIAVLDSDKLVK